MEIARRFYGFAQNGRPAYHLLDYVRDRPNIAGYSVDFCELDPAEVPAPRDSRGAVVRLRLLDGRELGPIPAILDNREGRGHVYLVPHQALPPC